MKHFPLKLVCRDCACACARALHSTSPSNKSDDVQHERRRAPFPKRTAPSRNGPNGNCIGHAVSENDKTRRACARAPQLRHQQQVDGRRIVNHVKERQRRKAREGRMNARVKLSRRRRPTARTTDTNTHARAQLWRSATRRATRDRLSDHDLFAFEFQQHARAPDFLAAADRQNLHDVVGHEFALVGHGDARQQLQASKQARSFPPPHSSATSRRVAHCALTFCFFDVLIQQQCD